MVEQTTEQGGMYNILGLLSKKEILEAIGKEFTTKDLCKYSDLCERSISNNLNRLYRAGLLIRIEGYHAQGGKKVTYKISEGVLEFARTCLY